jgi:hypothetical protein
MDGLLDAKMKFKLLFGLALVLSGVLSGCSTSDQPPPAGIAPSPKVAPGTQDEPGPKVFLVGIDTGRIEIPYTPDLTVMRAIAAAGGYGEFAHTRYFYLIRCGELTRVDVDAITSGNASESFTNDLPLKAWDVIYKPHREINF